MFLHASRTRRRGATAGLLLAILTLAAPGLVRAADFTVTTIPGEGWIQAPDNSAGESAALVAGPAGGLGIGSVELATNAATSDYVGIGRPLVQSLSSLSGGSWMTYVTGDSGTIASEPASLRFAIFRDGLAEFTTLVVERVYNATITADTWQTTSISDSTVVWQTNATGNFCITFPFCTLGQFKAQYQNANITALQVAIGTGIPVTTSWVDGVSLTSGQTTDTWDFEVAAAPTPTPTPSPSPSPTAAPTGTAGPTATAAPTGTSAPATAAPTTAVTPPATDVTDPAAVPNRVDGRLFALFAVGILAILALTPGRRRGSTKRR